MNVSGEIKSLIHEKVFKREDGSRVKIQVRIETNYHVRVAVCEPRKKTFRFIDITDDYSFRGVPFGSEAREVLKMSAILKYCTREEIQEVAEELWMLNKPNFLR